LGKRKALNRFLAQPIERNNANKDGGFSANLMDIYTRLARGMWGVVIIETTATSQDQKCRAGQLVLDESTNNEASWIEFFKRVKSVGVKDDQDDENDNRTLWIVEISAAGHKNISGPKKALFKGQWELSKGPVLSTDEIEEILEQYVQATRLAYERGADGIDFKMCHGYFAGILLRPNNLRDDNYGGDFKNRTRFLREYVRRAKKEVGDSKFVWATRVNSWDGGIPGGIGMGGPLSAGGISWIRSRSEIEELYKLLDQLGFHLANVSTSIPAPNSPILPKSMISREFLTYQEEAIHAATTFKKTKSNIKVASAAWSALGPNIISVGEAYLKTGIDFIGLGRWQICEPLLPKLVIIDAEREGRDPYQTIEDEANVCLACGKCGSGLSGKGPVKCVIYQE
ncbi:MAG: oxidoreductase, partial [Promethearchaeota archaeon]